MMVYPHEILQNHSLGIEGVKVQNNSCSRSTRLLRVAASSNYALNADAHKSGARRLARTLALANQIAADIANTLYYDRELEGHFLQRSSRGRDPRAAGRFCCPLCAIRRAHGDLWPRSRYASHSSDGRWVVRVETQGRRRNCTRILLHCGRAADRG